MVNEDLYMGFGVYLIPAIRRLGMEPTAFEEAAIYARMLRTCRIEPEHFDELLEVIDEQIAAQRLRGRVGSAMLAEFLICRSALDEQMRAFARDHEADLQARAALLAAVCH